MTERFGSIGLNLCQTISMSMAEPFGQRFVMRCTTVGAHRRCGRRKMSQVLIVDANIRQDGAKRRQIMDGARAVFLARGFDDASMGEIARQAGVSKGTLYVYFDSKEALFEAIVEEECPTQAEQVFALDSNDHDIKAVLMRLGCAFVRFLSRPGGL